MSSCPVCCSTFSLAVRKPVNCPSCHYQACAACIKKYLLSHAKDADCMSCHKLFDREYLTEALTKSFMENAYRGHRENVLVEREMALLPDTQYAVEHYRLAESLRRDVSETGRLMDEMKRTILDMHESRERQGRQLHRILMSGFTTDGTGGGQGRGAPQERREKFICGCPSEECRGFVSNSTHTCGTCSTKICKECLEPVGGDDETEQHMCDQNKVATAKLLKKDSKPCPKCAVMITKISGCDQMWCTACHVAFSWRTGEIETNHIHNPHWYEWQRSRSATGEIPREPGDRPGDDGMCVDEEEMLMFGTLNNILRNRHELAENHPYYLYLGRIHREVRHIQRVELPALRDETERTRDRQNMDLRLQYLLQRVDRAEWKRKLVLREKAASRKRELRQIFELYCTVATDNLNALARRENGKTPTEALIELKALAQHANEAFNKTCKRYSCGLRKVYGNSMIL